MCQIFNNIGGKTKTQAIFSATVQARLMNESLGREVQSRRAAQAALGKRERDVERLQGEVAAYKVPQRVARKGVRIREITKLTEYSVFCLPGASCALPI